MKTAVVAGGGKLGEGRAQEALEEATGDLEGTVLRRRAEVAGVQRPLFWGDPTRLKVGRPVRRISSAHLSHPFWKFECIHDDATEDFLAFEFFRFL